MFAARATSRTNSRGGSSFATSCTCRYSTSEGMSQSYRQSAGMTAGTKQAQGTLPVSRRAGGALHGGCIWRAAPLVAVPACGLLDATLLLFPTPSVTQTLHWFNRMTQLHARPHGPASHLIQHPPWLARSSSNPTLRPAACSAFSNVLTVSLCFGASGSCQLSRISWLRGVFMGMNLVGNTGSPKL